MKKFLIIAGILVSIIGAVIGIAGLMQSDGKPKPKVKPPVASPEEEETVEIPHEEIPSDEPQQ